MRGRIAIASLIAITAPAASVPAQAQQYPNRPITLVVPLPPGGTNDIMARVVGERLSQTLGQQVIVENRAAGGSGTVATRQVAKSAPDGYTLLLSYTSTFATAPSMYRNIGYDVRKDFAPIGLIASAPSLVLAHQSLPARNVPELIALIKQHGEPFQYGSPGVGTVNHLAAEMFAREAGIKLMQIPYRGSNPLASDLIGGHVKLGFNPIPVSRSGIEGGLVRALAVTSLKRSSLLANVPTLAESGLPGFDVTLRYGISAPAGTPRAVVERLNKELNAALATESVRTRIVQEGAEPVPISPEEYAADIDREETRWSAVIKSIGIQPE